MCVTLKSKQLLKEVQQILEFNQQLKELNEKSKAWKGEQKEMWNQLK